MTGPAPPARHHPPIAPAVSYDEVRRVWGLGRFTLAVLLFAGAGAAFLTGAQGGWAKVAAAATLVLLGFLDRHIAPPLGLSIAGFALAVTAGFGSEYAAPLTALGALIPAVAILVLSPRQAIGPMLAIAVGAAVRLTAFAPEEAGAGAAAALALVETTAYLLLVVPVMIRATGAIRSARRAQADAVDSERRAGALKNEFVSMVSHELRTPLTSIAGFAMALRDSWRTLEPGEVDEFLGTICGEAEHLRRLVDDVLVVPRLEAGRLLIAPADFPLQAAAFRIADLVFPPGGAKVASVTVGGNVLVHADPNRVEQVLRNLLENAAKYGGPQVQVDAAAQGDEWVVIVADDGPGIDEASRERIFTAFEQGNPSAATGSGLGLGLTVSRVLVEAMGGRIWYEPGFPKGARFCFTLPAAQTSPVRASAR